MAITDNSIQYAVVIDVSNDTRTIPDVGMVNGVLKFISNADDGVSLVYEDDTPATGFLEGYLIDEPITGLSNKIDISEGGSMASMNTCKVSIDNDVNSVTGDSYISRLLSNGVYITNSKITIYFVIDGKLYSRFGGVISESAYNEKYLIFTAKDYNEDNFIVLAGGDNSQVVYGNSGYVPLTQISDDVRIETCIGHTYSESNVIGSLGNIYLSLSISRDLYLELFNGPAQGIDQLVGWYVKPRSFSDTNPEADYDTAIKIISNSKPVTSFVITNRWVYNVDVQLEYPFDDVVSSQMFGNNGLFPNETAEGSIICQNTNPSEKLWFDLIKFNSTYKVSDGDIANVVSTPNGRPLLYTFNEDSREFNYYSPAISYEDGIITTNSNSENVIINNYTYIDFEGARYSNITNIQGIIDNDGNVIIEDIRGDSNWYNASTLLDLDLSAIPIESEYKHVYNEDDDSITGKRGIVFELDVPDDVVFDEYDGLAISIGMSVRSYTYDEEIYTSANGNSLLSLNVKTLASINQSFYTSTGNETLFKLSNNAITEGKLELNRDVYGEFLPTEIAYSLEPSETATTPPAKVYFNPEDNDVTLPTDCLRKWGATFVKSGVSGFIQDVQQSLTDVFTFDSDPIVTARDGSRKIYLWISGDPNDSGDVTINQEAKMFFNSIRLIGKKEVTADKLYVKCNGEILETNNVSFGNLTYRDIPVDWSVGEWASYILPPSSTEGYLYIYPTDNTMAQAILGLNIGDQVIMYMDANNFQVHQLRSQTINYFDPGIYVLYTNIVDHEGDPIDGDLYNLAGPTIVGTTNVYNIFKDLLENKNGFTDVVYNNVDTNRSLWDAGRSILTSISSKDLVKSLAQQSFVGLFTNREGNLELDAFKDYAVYDYNEEGDYYYWKWDDGVSFRTFNTDNINNKSIKNAKSTQLNNIINNITLLYDYNVGTSDYNETYYVTKVDGTFPSFGSNYSDYSNIPDYTTASILWNHANETYLRNGINKTIDKKPQLQKCDWYFKSDIVGVMGTSIHYYITDLIEWITKSKNMITFSIPLTTDNITIDLLDRVTFSDVLLTGGTEIIGWVTSIKPNVKKMEIEIEITTVPTDLIPVYQFIDESSTTIDDQLDESPNTGEEVDEQFTL